jgi:hypothetical protein
MSERYLLFDGGCSVCAALAREVETLSGGRLRVRSLRDPEVQALLDRARPGWRWEPMLVEIEGERVRVLAGLSLRALRVAQAVARFGSFISKSNSGRLQFLFYLFYIFLLSFVFNTLKAAAHDWNICGDGIPVRWYGTSTSHWWPTSWDSSYQLAIQQAARNFNASDFDYYWAQRTSALMLWGDLNYPDINVAGATSIYVNCTTHIIQAGSFYFNFPHFNAIPHTVDQKICTAIHELGHGAGFAHNSLYSILYADHGQRCHNWLITNLQSHDYQDINNRY